MGNDVRNRTNAARHVADDVGNRENDIRNMTFTVRQLV
jgi:hypothetical protein